MLQDVRYGVRLLLRKPGFTAVAIISLALGIGANTAVFSVLNAILLKSLPYAEPDRLILAWGAEPARGKDRGQVSATDVHDWRRQNGVFEDITTFGNWTSTITENGDPERIRGMQVGDGYFSIMRGTPILGRVFLPEEQEEGKDFVVVLSYGLWQRRFGGDPDVIGKTVYLSSRPYTVVGVMGEDFAPLPTSVVDAAIQLYRPVAEPFDEQERASRHLRAIARLRPGVTPEQAQADMNVIARRIEEEHPASNTGYQVRLVSLREDTVGDLRPALLLLFGAVLFVLLIACANVSNLLLVRATARQKEIAIRAALGASRGRLVRQLLVESVLLAVIGGGLGLLLALWGVGLIESLGSEINPSFASIESDPVVLSFTAILSLVTGCIFGMAPALHASRPDLNESLKEGARGSAAGHNRLRSLLVVSEISMALVLLICAGLMIRSVLHMREIDPGFKTEKLLTMNVWLPSAKYPDRAKQMAFYDEMLARLGALPGVESTGLVSVLPMGGNFDGRAIQIEDKPVALGEEADVELYIATPGYLRAMEIRLLKGRLLTEQDVQGGPEVALISETMAEQFWPGEDPIGKRVKFPGSASRPQPWRSVVGVVNDVKLRRLDEGPAPQLYLPHSQYSSPFMTLVVRTGPEPIGMTSAVRGEIQAVDKDQAVFNVATMEQLLSDSISLRRFSMLLLGVFSAVALTLAAVGIYGVMSYLVTQRTREIGIRIALGAQRRDVVRLVVREAMTITVAGIVVGLVGAFVLTRLMGSLLYGVSATDPVTFAGITVMLTSVAMVASYVPARRATKVDPMVALRYE